MLDLDYLFETSGHVVGLNITNGNNLQKYKQFEKRSASYRENKDDITENGF